MTRGSRILLALVLALAGVAVAARALLLPWLHGAIERAGTDALGREVAIAGPLAVSFSAGLQVTATGVTVANMTTGSEPVMLRAERVTAALDAASLVAGSLRLRDVELEGVRVLIEEDADGRRNWSFASAKPKPEPATPSDRFPLDIAHAALRRVEVIYRPPGDAAPMALGAQELDARLDATTRRLDVRGTGEVAAKPWSLRAGIDSIDTLWAGGDVVTALDGGIGDAKLELCARTRGPFSVSRPELEGRASGPDVASFLATFGLTAPLTGEFRLSGRLTPAGAGTNVDLEARAEGIEAHLLGTLEGLALRPSKAAPTLDLAVDAAGPDAARLGSRLGLQGLPQQAFAVEGRLRGAGGHWCFADTTLHVGSTAIAVSGELAGAPVALTRLALQAKGMNLADFSELARVALPRGPFAADARLRRSADSRWTLDAATLRAGRSSLAISGTIGTSTGLAGTELAVEAQTADSADVALLRSLRLPKGPFALAGRLARLDHDRWALSKTRIQAGTATLSVSGSLGDPPKLVGTDLVLKAKGNDFAELSALTRLDLPAGPFEVTGRLARRTDALAIDGATLRLRGASLTTSGTIGDPPGFPTLDLAFAGSGPDLASFADVARTALPQGPFTLEGRVARVPEGLALHAVKAAGGGETVEADGRVALRTGIAGSDLTLRAAGPDLGRFALRFGIADLPELPFEIRGRVRPAADAYTLDRIVATVGPATATVDGRLGRPSARDRTSVAVHVRAPELRALADWKLPPSVAERLGAAPFSLDAHVRLDRGVVRADDGVLALAENRVAFHGTLGALPSTDLLDLELEASGTSAAGLARALAGPNPDLPARLPEAPFSIAGRLLRAPFGVALRGFAAQIDQTWLHLDGTLGVEEGWRGTDLRFDAGAPDASLIAAATRASSPAGAFTASGRLAVADGAILFDRVALAIGDTHAEVDGRLGSSPASPHSDLRVAAGGPNLEEAAGPLASPLHLPGVPFSVSARIVGDAGRFATRDLALRVGENDLAGSVALRLGERRALEADLRAKRLSLTELFGGRGEPGAAGSASAPRAPGVPLIPTAPLPWIELPDADATVRLEAAEIVTPAGTWRDLAFVGLLHADGARVERLEATGPHGGRATLRLALAPRAGRYHLEASGRVDGARLRVAGESAPDASLPALDLEVELRGDGRSLHELAAHADGRVLAVLGPGAIAPELSRRVRTGVLRELLETLNPFRQGAPQSTLECGILVADLTAGRATLEPIAMRTDRLTVTGNGNLDLAREAIDLSWIVKPRQGLGLSASTLAASYVKLGGTLTAPKLDMKPLSAAVATGAAVATAGITLLSRQLYNRLTAERSVCANALAEYRRKARQQPARPARGGGGR